ncbi:MAG: NTP transferase domain-containing protein [Planctomycetota bacterium]
MSSGIHALVLAAGKGKRMGAPIPKVMVQAAGRPLLGWVLKNLEEAGADRITAIVGFGKEEVIASLPEGVCWVEQAEQRGTGHAVLCAREALAGFEGTVLVTCGDMPLIRGATFRKLLDRHEESGADCTMLTATVEPPHRYGRILRDAKGRVKRIVEAEDATEEELSIAEVNTGVYAFRAPFLFQALRRVGNANRQGEYYLTEVVEILLRGGRRVEAISCEDAREALGVNSSEDLARVEAMLAGVGP